VWRLGALGGGPAAGGRLPPYKFGAGVLLFAYPPTRRRLTGGGTFGICYVIRL
jgi:hypothetical protein